MKIVQPSVKLLWVTESAQQMMELAGRTCYKSEDKITQESAGKFIRTLRKSGHHAMLEHANASFRIITDRGITHEIVRHRIASYGQESTRYCNYSKDKFGNECSFIEPPGLGEYSRQQWLLACMTVEDIYFRMLNGIDGITPQIARSVLPNCLKTEIVMTCNFREWRHFIKLRGASDAHPQIRPIALDLWIELMNHAPAMFEDLTPEGYDK